MQWRKLGRIFDPKDHALPAGCVEYAQSPQALVCGEVVRIYFSTRSVDPENGKYRSHVAFAELDRGTWEVVRVAEREVLPLGGLGAFDEHGIFPMNVLRHGDAVYGYTTGWTRRVSVSVDTGVGLAVSRDGGLSFERLGPGPVLSASPQEPCLVGDAFVKVLGGTWHMWYIFGTGWRRFAPGAAPDRTYKIGHAVSRDGIEWTRPGGRQIVADRLGRDESQALPTVVEIAGRWHMFFCWRQSFDFRSNIDRGYRIGHAWSDDLEHWTRDDDHPGLRPGAPGEWDSQMQCYPHAFEVDGSICLLYNGNEFGRRGFGLAVLEP